MAQKPSKRLIGLQGSARSWYSAGFSLRQPILHIVPDSRRAARVCNDLRFFLGEDHVLQLPEWDCLPFEQVSPQVSISAERMHTLWKLCKNEAPVVVASAAALLQRSLSRKWINQFVLELESGSELTRDELIERLTLCGYHRVSLTEGVGEYSERGEIVDFFPFHEPQPCRVEFSDSRIRTIRLFDTNSQRSTREISSTSIIPVREAFRLSLESMSEEIAVAREKIKARAKETETPTREVKSFLQDISHGRLPPGIELIQAVALGPTEGLADFLCDTRAILFDDLHGIERAMDERTEQITERFSHSLEQHLLVPPCNALYDPPLECLSSLAAFPSLRIDSVDFVAQESIESEKIVSGPNTALSESLKASFSSEDPLGPLEREINRRRDLGFTVAFVVGSEQRAQRLKRLLLDRNFDAQVSSVAGHVWLQQSHRAPLSILIGHLTTGFQIEAQKILFISENEIFPERSYRKQETSSKSIRKLMSSLAQLTEGDYVVHEDYGIGRYQGLRHIEVEHQHGDFLHIEYADSTLYLPATQIGKIQKFIGAEGVQPALDRLGSSRWKKTKAKVQKAVAELAGDLVRLYASRSVIEGHAFTAHPTDEEIFAESFPYDETPDQLQAIEETLHDMELERPMDRLVCGDVGFGKTEVALRAAYRSALHGKQVAVLAPTTILVEQHFETISNRMRDFPVRVGVISRFYSSAENKETLQKLRTGMLDIIVGTHRLLSNDVEFHDLGLIVIDEEHRFGVRQKEKIKNLKRDIDVLTLTATPIPRTLHMSLIDIREISVIASPPHDRKSIRTYVAEKEDSLIRDAILRELQRNGQCFYLFNRIQGIEYVTEGLRELVPEARFEFAHGQMKERTLEDIMHRFLNGEIDVLVSTTIIESGLDIPNANTMIIERADCFGLAQLYQLRGRVGRSARQAYTYLTIPSAKRLGNDAKKRLEALQSLDDLGLGFNLAIRDLEIRGAGNLLGKEQSGNVMSVGYELYSKILRQAIQHLKGSDVSTTESIDPEVKINVPAFIPQPYIPDISERLVLYQRLSAASSDQEIDDLSEEIEDRFGTPGFEVKSLLEVTRLRALLRYCGVVRGEFLPERFLLSFHRSTPVAADRVLEYVSKNRETVRFSNQQTLSIRHEEITEEDPTLRIQQVKRLMRFLMDLEDSSSRQSEPTP